MVSRKYAAFTLVELLVVIAIIGILVGLLLPAVQAAREAARRTQCQSNMKNIGLGLLNYENTFKSLPPGRKGCDGDSQCRTQRNANRSPVSGLLLILPFLEEQAIYDRYQPMVKWSEVNVGFDTNAWFNQPGNVEVVAQRPDVYVCGSDQSPATSAMGDVQWSLSSYCLVSGSMGLDQFNPMKYNNDGLFYYVHQHPLRRVVDGMNHTLMVAEQLAVSTSNDIEMLEANGIDVQKINFWAVGLGGRWGLLNTNRPINHSLLAGFRGGADGIIDYAHSNHPGGAQFVFGDGRVDFLNDNIDLQVYWALGTRAGPIDELDKPSYIYGRSPGFPLLEDHNYRN